MSRDGVLNLLTAFKFSASGVVQDFRDIVLDDLLGQPKAFEALGLNQKLLLVSGQKQK